MYPEPTFNQFGDSRHPQNLGKTKQELKQKPRQMSAQEKKQAMTNDVFGRLMAEMGAAVLSHDKNSFLQPVYSQYLSVKDEDPVFYLQNIEIMLLTLQSYCSNKTEKSGFWGSEKIVEQGAKIPEIDPNYLQQLSDSVSHLKWNNPVKLTVEHVLDGIKQKTVTELPQNVCDLIKSAEERDKEVKYQLHSNKTSLVAPSYVAEGIRTSVDQRLNENPIDVSNPTISPQPLYDVRHAPKLKEQKGFM
jgi:hypothetical protein